MSMKNRVVNQLSQMVAEHSLSATAADLLERMILKEFDGWLADKVSQMDQLIVEWESRIPASEQGMYSLGIRRAIDIVNGNSALDQLPILETESTPDE
jgi:hypothetical protein